MLSISGQAFNALEQTQIEQQSIGLRNLAGLWLGRPVPDDREVAQLVRAAQNDPLRIEVDPADREGLLLYGALIEVWPALPVDRALLAIDLVFDRRPASERMMQLRAMAGR